MEQLIHNLHWPFILALVGFMYRIWAPMRKEREDLIRWRAEQEAKDRAHETQMANMEARLDDGKAKFDQIMELLHDIKVDFGRASEGVREILGDRARRSISVNEQA